MFRECYFEYAGISSQPYNLILAYVSNSNEDFDSGGRFDLETDTLPRSHETLLYGKNYSAQPLEYDVEFINPDGYIPLKQMIEIKNWLYGQNGWKTFRCLDDRQDYHLKCIFEPGEDIVDGTGYRGLRSKLRNISPFWYGVERTIYKNSGFSLANGNYYYAFQIDVPNNNNVDREIFPKITIGIDRSQNDGYAYDRGRKLILENTSAQTLAQGRQVNDSITYPTTFVYPATSRIQLSTEYIEDNAEVVSYNCVLDSSDNEYYIQITHSDGEFSIPTDMTTQPTQAQVLAFLNNNGYYSKSFDTDTSTGTAIYANDNITIDSRDVVFKSERLPSAKIKCSVDETDPKKMFRLHYGTNILRMYYPWALKDISFKYTPLYRLGAF